MGSNTAAFADLCAARITVAAAAITAAATQSFGCSVARTGVGVYVMTMRQARSANECIIQATPDMVTFAAVTYVQDTALQITFRTWDAAGVALEVTGLSMSVRPCTKGAPGAN